MSLVRSDVSRIRSLALLGSYVPRKCGIATFTHDLRNALASQVGAEHTSVLAMDDQPESYPYGPDVRFQIRAQELRDYRTAADVLNINQIDLTVVQHEYGIYGGQDGAYVLDLMRRLRMPIITTLHTVLTEPNRGQRRVMLELSRLSDRLVVMSHLAYDILHKTYGIPHEKIALIPHGIHDVPFTDSSFYKDQFGFEGRKVLLTFGLLSPGKGIEYAIRAMPKIVARHPDVVYVVLGATHPHILRHEGDAYRHSLERLVDKLGVREHVEFHNRFAELDELVRYIGAADLYITPYLNEAQITSGTLAYSVGAGKAVVSTPYWHATELLDEGRGRLVPFHDSDAIAEAVNALIGEEVECAAMRKRAYLHCRPMVWEEVAKSYLQTANEINRERASKPRVDKHPAVGPEDPETLPGIKLGQLETLTDQTGLLQHAIYSVPDRSHGYATDDNARALIALAKYQAMRHDATVTPLVMRYLAFLYDAFDREAHRFRAFMSYDRQWQPQGNEDTHGRALWALGQVTASTESDGVLGFATRLFGDALGAAESFQSPRAIAHALVGIHAYLSRFGGDTHARRIRKELADRLYDRFHLNAKADWPWHEPALSHEAARMPHALILAGQWLPDGRLAEQGLRTLQWLVDMQLGDDGTVSLLGNAGWLDSMGHRAHFDQMPTEAMHLILACTEAYHCTRDRAWARRARQLLNWFVGDNDTQSVLYDNKTGGCRDALHADGPNLNQGAAATTSWLVSLTTVHDLLTELGVSDQEEDGAAAEVEIKAATVGEETGESTKPVST